MARYQPRGQGRFQRRKNCLTIDNKIVETHMNRTGES